ncbi:MAG: F0F1 ATP synthase subunit epsilon [Candidatus Nanopelagicales bacterium]|nr:F0F1 ATP synthase subunit epsilon [Candidatus Nanopelagicales bacterium]
MADPLRVRLVATDRSVWRGEAILVTLVTIDGSIGIMPGHSPLLGILENGPVLIRQPDGVEIVAAVHTGFALVDAGEVIIMAQSAELAGEIDVERAKALLEEARASEPGPGRDAAEKRAEIRLKIAAER